jgi:hypothetical protein
MIGRLRKLHSLVETAGFRRDRVAQFLKHVDDHHAVHGLVFDDEHSQALRTHPNAPARPMLTLVFFKIQLIHDLVEMPFRYGIAKAGFSLQALGILNKECFASCFH